MTTDANPLPPKVAHCVDDGRANSNPDTGITELRVPTPKGEVDDSTSDAVPSGLQVTTGGLLLWGGTVGIGVSTVVLLAVLSRHLHHEGFTGLATLFGLFFVASLIPSGFPLRAAALAVDGAEPMRIKAVHVTLLAVAGAALSPFVAYTLHLPVLAVLFVAGQVIVAMPLAIRRGSLIAARRFDAMGGNLFLESALRIALGMLAGLVWGLDGLSIALCNRHIGCPYCCSQAAVRSCPSRAQNDVAAPHMDRTGTTRCVRSARYPHRTKRPQSLSSNAV